jgi:hypothetical protein
MERAGVRAGWGATAATAAVGLDVAVLTLLLPRPGALRAQLAHPLRWIAAVGADRAAATVAGLGLWLLAAWLGVGFVAVLVGRLPGAAGALGRRLAVATLPGVLHRTFAGAAGLGVLLSPVAAIASVPHAGPPPRANYSTSGTVPAASTAGTVPATPTAGTVPAPVLPTDSVAPPSLPRSPSSTHEDARRARTRMHCREKHAGAVRVTAGDSLWAIAAAHLPPDASPARIADAWPHWFMANRHVIGPDPDYLVPGEILHPPRQPSPPSSTGGN